MMPPIRTAASVPLRALLQRFALIYLPAAVILTAAIAASIHLDANARLDGVRVREAARIEIARNLLAQDFAVVTSDLRILATTPALRRYLDRGSPAEFDDLSGLLLSISRATRRYDQVRYLDENGFEIIRVNYNAGQPALVPRDQLQDKSGRYFFRDTIRLGKGGIFVSPLDLNVEHDRLELPHKPMIRFGMPVFDSAGRKRGVILLNYFGEELLGNFRDAMRGGDPRIGMLLNRDGYWLSSPRSGDEWGFMLGRQERTFGRDFPEEWRTIAANESGALKTEKGLFVHATVYPLQAGQRSSSGSPLPRAPSERELGESEYSWKIVSFVPEEALAGRAYYNQPGARVLLFVTYLLFALGAAVTAYVSVGRKQARDELRENERRLREITGTMSDGLLVMDREGRITFANPEALALLGYGLDELIGADMHETLHVKPDGTLGPRSECKVLKVARTGTTYRGVEEAFKCKDGTLLPVSVSASAIIKEPETTGIVVAFHDITERKNYEHELERRAQTDALTGLNNRRHFYELAEQELARARRYGKPLAALMLDVDHFKRFNDTYGHHVGDAVLRKLSEVCTRTLREIDVIGRFGGEEFAVLLPETAAEQAMEAAERLRLAVTGASIQIEGGEALCFTVSIGMSGLALTDGDIDAVLKRADAALYEAKNAGRNRVCGKTAGDVAV
jgi:diguanylate cyclase (GGDEF)-like protein/PAS domain S-box-containing protein